MSATTNQASDKNAKARGLMSAPPPPINGEYHLLCRECATWKPKSAFYLGGTGKPKPACKDCDHARRRAKYHANRPFREKIHTYNRAYYAANRDYLLERTREHYQANRERYVEAERQRRRARREREQTEQPNL